MKKKLFVMGLVLCMAAEAGCGAKGETEPAGNGISDGPAQDEGVGTADPDAGISDGKDGEADPLMETITLRIVDGAETGSLVLAGEGAGDVYTLYVGDADVFVDGTLSNASVIEDGMVAEIRYTGGIMESWPGQIGNVESISVYSRGTQQNPLGEYYDLCGLYLQVLNDLWDVDSGLNDGAVYVSVDLSDAPGELTEGEKAAIAWIFACEHDVLPLTLTYSELAEQGYLSEWREFEDGEQKIYEWKDGVIFSIKAEESGETEIYSLPVLRFHAQKWRSPLGAYFYEDCKAVWPEGGSWESYSVGAEAIS